MKKLVQYALTAALDEVIGNINNLEGKRSVKDGSGKQFWQADSIGLNAEIGEALTEILGEEVKFLCTGGRSTLFINGEQMDVVTPIAYNRRLREIEAARGAA